MGVISLPKTSTMLTLLILISIVSLIRGQATGQEGACTEKLAGCFAYLNGTTTPPSGCCTPLKDAITNEKPCLCGLYANPAVLKGFGVNVTQALDLPVRCKIQTHSDVKDFCKGVAVTPSGSPSTNSSSSPTTGGTGSGSGSGSGKNSAVMTTGTGFISSLLMLVAYVVVY